MGTLSLHVSGFGVSFRYYHLRLFPKWDKMLIQWFHFRFCQFYPLVTWIHINSGRGTLLWPKYSLELARNTGHVLQQILVVQPMTTTWWNVVFSPNQALKFTNPNLDPTNGQAFWTLGSGWFLLLLDVQSNSNKVLKRSEPSDHETFKGWNLPKITVSPRRRNCWR